jgi:hypothetical protein
MRPPVDSDDTRASYGSTTVNVARLSADGRGQVPLATRVVMGNGLTTDTAGGPLTHINSIC